ncbi:39S ribosomal protein L52, mitochondrial [Phlebotomus papatasi]|uniref:39S ribosomal protein L52, mitochondrial n=1 Tax=Phlebotomus papatasi TaxID=29031 RepID=UPI002483FD47|nr:39S ribosomal protein L52, mitochondrial [Phlebotomus papatasi]
MNKIPLLRINLRIPFITQVREKKYDLHDKSVLKPPRGTHICKIFKTNPTKFGPLTNMPDYTFMDGRPTPLGTHQRTRLEKQKVIATKIVALNKELAFAKERHQRILREQAEERKNILEGKLKEKGHLML